MASYTNYLILALIQFLVVLALLHGSMAYPRHQLSPDYYEEEPESIPVHLLRIPMQVDIRPTKIEDFPSFSPSSSASKRSHRNRLQGAGHQAKTCCPSNREIVEPIAGKNRAGDLVELYQTESVRQRFYEISCAPSVAEKPCRYLDDEHRSRSKCEQQYSYTYALVRDMVLDGARTDRGWRLDYILVRSGCSCQISPAADD